MSEKVRMFCGKCGRFTEHISETATVEDPYHKFTCSVCGYRFEVRVNPWALAKMKKKRAEPKKER